MNHDDFDGKISLNITSATLNTTMGLRILKRILLCWKQQRMGENTSLFGAC